MDDRGGGRVTAGMRRADRVGLEARVLGLVLVLMALFATATLGQQAAELTLEDAISLARANNPTFLSTQNDQSAANWQEREAYAQFLPTVSTTLGGTLQQEGSLRFGSVAVSTSPETLYSGYGINFGMTIDGNTIFGIPNARANKRATEARIDAADFLMGSLVAFQYMAVLRAQDGVDVAQRQLDRARQNRQIVNTRVQTGAVAGTDGRQAEVDLGRAEVALIQAERDLRQARNLLAEQLGVPLEVDTRLSSEFEVFQPEYDLEELLATAQAAHPSLTAFRAQESASRAQARQVSTSQYLPSLSLSARLSGQAQEIVDSERVLARTQAQAASQVQSCEYNNALVAGIPGGLPGLSIQDCGQYAYTPALGEQALAQNNAFPFDFESTPATFSAQLSLPIFTGFTRQRQVAQANNAAEDAEHNRRAEELRLRTAVTNAYDNVESAYRVVQAEARNRTLAEEQLTLQQRRYALGAADLLLLMDAQTTTTTADQAYLNAVYDFHYNLILLEAAVGQQLRPE